MVVCACVFLTAKIFEAEKKIRDILNAIYTVIQLYQLARQDPESQPGPLAGNYIHLQRALEGLTAEQVMARIQPSY